MTEERYLRLHFGAHKTASTHLVALIKANESAVSKHNTEYLPKSLIRSTLMKAVGREVKGGQANDRWARALAEMPKEKSLLVSEENVIGITSVANPRSGIYPHGPERTHVALKLLNATPRTTELFFVVRSPESFFVSAWCEAARSNAMPGFRRWLGPAPLGQPYWCRLIERVSDALPGYPITVWTYERYVKNPRAIFPLLLGQPIGTEMDLVPVDNIVRKRPSERALKEIAALRSKVGKITKRQANLIVKKFPSGNKFSAPDFFSDEEKRVLRAGYQNDLERIGTLPDVTLYA